MISHSLHNIKNAEIIESKNHDLYQYRCYIGNHKITTSRFNSYWFLDNDLTVSMTGHGNEILSDKLCVEIFGYTPETRTSSFYRYSDLPYINGCSTKQLINPVRPGDPTWQLLYMPKHTTEQAHHVHSTARIVYVQEGLGKSFIGIGEYVQSIELTPGDILILDKMIPHHFSTSEEHLVVLPIHIFSSTHEEKEHPMYKGTFSI